MNTNPTIHSGFIHQQNMIAMRNTTNLRFTIYSGHVMILSDKQVVINNVCNVRKGLKSNKTKTKWCMARNAEYGSEYIDDYI